MRSFLRYGNHLGGSRSDSISGSSRNGCTGSVDFISGSSCIGGGVSESHHFTDSTGHTECRRRNR